MLGILGGEGKQENKNEVQEMENYGAEAGSAVKLLEELLNLGYRKNASDIHLEPQEDRMVVRMRLDGMLLHVREYDKEMHQPLVTRAKVLSGMDIAKKRVPQDGHFKEMIDGICLDVRTSVVPTIFGEKMVLRLLNMKTEIDHGKTFGMREKNYEKMKRILRSPGGILYLTGPTGCGKTTTLYMILEYLAKQPVNIVTIEDPVERYLPGISQMQVNEQAGITFEAGLRAVLRQDPDLSWSARRGIRRQRKSVSARQSPVIWCSRLCTRKARRAESREWQIWVSSRISRRTVYAAWRHRDW